MHVLEKKKKIKQTLILIFNDKEVYNLKDQLCLNVYTSLKNFK